MPVFRPIETGFSIRQDQCDLVNLQWQSGRVVADFVMSSTAGEETSLIRTTIDSPILVRIVDELVFSVDGQDIDLGINANGFAYEVEGASLLAKLPYVVLAAYGDRKLMQFDFISLSTCLEVLSYNFPYFERLAA